MLIIEAFTLTKGMSLVALMFESSLIWLASLSPLAFKSLCFGQFGSLEDIMKQDSLADEFFKKC